MGGPTLPVSHCYRHFANAVTSEDTFERALAAGRLELLRGLLDVSRDANLHSVYVEASKVANSHVGDVDLSLIHI